MGKPYGVGFNYQWVSSSLPRDLLDYVSFVPSPSDPFPIAPNPASRGRGRGRGRLPTNNGRGTGRGVGRGVRASSDCLQIQATAGNGDPETSTNNEKQIDLEDGGEDGADVGNEEIDALVSGDFDDAPADLEDGEDYAAELDTAIPDGDGDSKDHKSTEEEADFDHVDVNDLQNIEGKDIAVRMITNSNDSMTVPDASATHQLVPSSISSSSSSAVLVERTHPLFGLWTGTFDVMGATGAFKYEYINIYICVFIYHVYMYIHIHKFI
jgi:hypothetical protein